MRTLRSHRWGLVLVVALACRVSEAPPSAIDSVGAGQEEESLAQLTALGYLGFVPSDEVEGVRGVVSHDSRRSSPGLTVFGNRHHHPVGYFFDPRGVARGYLRMQPPSGDSLLWMEPTTDGNLLVSGRGYLRKTTWTGEPIWDAPPGSYHHGFAQADDGTIYAMTYRNRRVEVDGMDQRIGDDQIIVLSSTGKLLRTISIFDVLGSALISPRLLELAAQGKDRVLRSDRELEHDLKVDHPRDVFHLNSVAVLRQDIGVARAGDLILSLRSLDLVLALSLDEPPSVRWQWTAGRQQLDRPHAPRPLANGNLLIFDNGWARGYSRLIELDPREERIVWQYVADPPESFYTRRGGMAQELANGNFLVTQSDAGRVFEITRAGEIVWDFWNPVFEREKPESRPRRRTIYRAWRWFAADLGHPNVPEELRP